MSNKKDAYITSSEAAKILGFTPTHVRRLIGRGKIKAEKVGANWILKPSAISGIKRVRWPRNKDVVNVERSGERQL